MRSMTLAGGFAAVTLALLGATAGAQTITEIIDASGDGAQALNYPWGIAVEAAVEGAGKVYVTGTDSDNAFKITPEGDTTQIIDGTGDGTYGLSAPYGIAVDARGNVYVTGGNIDRNVFKITPEGSIAQIIDESGDGTHELDGPRGVAVDAPGNVYVVGVGSHNAFKITPDGSITEIIDATGDGTHGLTSPRGIAVDVSGNAYVVASGSNNAFRIAPGGSITEIIDGTGDGSHGLNHPGGIAVDVSGAVYVTGWGSDNAFKITPGGSITQIVDATGDGTRGLDGPGGVAVDAAGIVYVVGLDSDNAFKITPGGSVTQIIDSTGDGTHGLDGPWGIAVAGSGIVYVTGSGSDNAFRVTPPGMALSAAAGLVVPGFEVDVADAEGPTTYFAVRNIGDQELVGRADFYGVASGEPLRSDAFILGPQATRTANVRDDLSDLEIADGLATGFVVITELDSITAPNLEGDYFRLDWGNDFATGDRLVRPADFCLRQEIRFVDFGSGSQLRVLLNRPRGEEVPSFSYTAYAESGTMVASGEVSTADYLSVLDVGELVVGYNFGTMIFDFSASGGGWASAKYSAFGRFSVELNAACRDH